jgi:tetratricopeptide (TPR) repeat protein
MMVPMLVLLASAAALQQSVPPLPAAAPSRILVVPFENAQKDPRVGWLGEAAAVLLADGLNARNVAAIRRPERVRAFEQLHLPVTATLSRATIIKVGELLGASEVIVGSFSVNGSALAVDAHSIRIEEGRLRPDVSERAPLKELFALFDRLARRLAAGAPLSSSVEGALPLGAFEQYIKGLIAESAATQATFLETAVREAPGFDRAKLALWDVRYEQGDHAAALATVRTVPATSAYSARARFRAGVSLLDLKRYAEAFDTFNALLHARPTADRSARYTAAPTLNNLGVVQLRRGTAEGGSATYFLTKAADADPGDPDYQFNLGYAYALDRDYKGAIYWLREAVRRDPADADAHFVLAVALQATGSAVEAARERELAAQLSSKYEQMQGQAPADPPAVPGGLERIRVDIELPHALRTEHSVSVPAQRDQQALATFHLDRGRRLFEKEQDREALAELRRATYLSPYASEAHLLIGRIHLRSGRTSEAIDALKISVWSEDTAAAHIVLAEAYLATKNTERARSELVRALALDPQSAEAKRLLGTIK